MWNITRAGVQSRRFYTRRCGTRRNTGNRAGNVSSIPGPNLYIAGVNNLVDSSSITYEGDSYMMRLPWGPWRTIGKIASQPTWNFSPVFLPSTLTGSGPCKIKELESGYYLLTTRHPDSNGYVPGAREVTIERGNPPLERDRLDVDMKKFPGLFSLYDGQWHVTRDDKWSVIPDRSGSERNLTMRQFSPEGWAKTIATYNTAGLVSFNGLSAQAAGTSVPESPEQTYFIVFRHCCRDAAKETEETLISSDIRVQRAAPDHFTVSDGTNATPELVLGDGSYYLLAIECGADRLMVYSSESLTGDPVRGGTLTAPIAEVVLTGNAKAVATVLGNALGNTNDAAKFFPGTRGFRFR